MEVLGIASPNIVYSLVSFRKYSNISKLEGWEETKVRQWPSLRYSVDALYAKLSKSTAIVNAKYTKATTKFMLHRYNPK